MELLYDITQILHHSKYTTPLVDLIEDDMVHIFHKSFLNKSYKV